MLNKLSSIRKALSCKALRAHSSCNIYISDSANISCDGDSWVKLSRNCHLHLHENANVATSGRYVFGRGCTIIVHKNGNLILGNESWALHDCWIEVGADETISIGDRVTMQLRCSIHGSVLIGDDVLMAPDVFISSGGHSFDKDNYLSIREQDKLYNISKPVVIGSNSWLGIRSWIAPGVCLAEGTITGANSVITKNTENVFSLRGYPSRQN